MGTTSRSDSEILQADSCRLLPEAPPPLDPHFLDDAEQASLLLALIQLAEARRQAEQQGRPTSSSALVLAALQDKGVRIDSLRWLVYHAHVEHLREVRDPNKGRAGLALAESILLRSDSFFALTDGGALFAERLLAPSALRHSSSAASVETLLAGRLAPHYDDRVFSWGRRILKVFLQPSENQTALLDAAQECGWPAWFDDPLPREPGANPKQRLHDTIKCLNRRQQPPLIHFKGDGTGRRVGWEER